jgi:thymidylate synthase
MPRFRTIDDAFVGMLHLLLTDGIEVASRNGATIELAAQTITIDQPSDRFLHTPGRNNNPFAAIAETMWVLAGRNDLAYLTPYLRRAPRYSDDGGQTWRAAYGPRLRTWHGVDQIAAVRALLDNAPDSRRAVISLFDPVLDYQDSADIPCNNWLHFLIRNGGLDLNVVARSTDIWFGFSAINAFEWSVLQEMLARWLRVEVGTITFFTSSLHLYAEHTDRARDVLGNASSGGIALEHANHRYDTGWEDATAAHGQWMNLEEQLRAGANLAELAVPFHDPLLLAFIRAIDIFWAFKRGTTSTELEPRLRTLGDSDLALAAREFINRPRAQHH